MEAAQGGFDGCLYVPGNVLTHTYIQTRGQRSSPYTITDIIWFIAFSLAVSLAARGLFTVVIYFQVKKEQMRQP